MKNRIKQIALAITTGIIFLTCTNPFFPGIVDNTPPPVNRTSIPNTYTITFHVGPNVALADDNSPEKPIIVLHLSEGAKIPKLPALKRTGDYGFGGWYTDEACTPGNKWNFNTTIKSNIDLYARWDPPPNVKVRFNTNSGAPQPGEQNLVNGTLVVEPPPITRDGYAFDGWYKEAVFINRWNFAADTVNANPGSTITLYAKWHPIVYTVKFETNGGEPAPVDQNITYGGKVFMPQSITRGGYGFGGWFKDAACTAVNEWNFTSDTVTGNITLYAKWDPDLFFVEFSPNFGEIPLAFEYIASGAKIYEQFPIEYNLGYGFGGWFKDTACTSGNEWNFASDPVTENTTLYAKWDPDLYLVKFDANGGDTAPPEQHIANGNTAVIPQAITREGYGFGGWFKDAACTAVNEWNFASDNVTDNITLYAKWVQNKPMYTVTFNTNSSLITVLPQTVIEGGKVVEPLGSSLKPLGTSINNPGYSFRGWYTEGGTLWNFATDTVSGNMILHAEWSIIYYTVVFNTGIIDSYTKNQNIIYGGGDQSPENQSIAYGGKINEPLDMTRDSMAIINGYGFDGWYWCADSKTPAASLDTREWIFENYPVGPDYVTIGTTNINLYPRWIKDQKYLDYTTPPNALDSSGSINTTDPINNGNLVWVRKGNFTMGSQSVSGSRPEHQVTLTKGFFMGMYLITREQYMKVMADDSNSNKDKQYLPVNRVTWLDAVMFCNKLTDMENDKKGTSLLKVYTIDESTIVLADGSRWPPISSHTIISAKVTINWDANGYRLPTEAEWEYAARGGKGSPGDFAWSGSDTASEVAWYGGTGGTVTDRQTRPVGLLKPNILRTFDMSGNLCEWCWDEYDSRYYSTSPASDPKGPGTNTVVINNPGQDTYRVRRGGSWNHGINNTRTFIRDSFQPTDTNMTNFWTIGFRVVRGTLQ